MSLMMILQKGETCFTIEGEAREIGKTTKDM